MGRLTEYFGLVTGDLTNENARFLTLTADQKRRARKEYRQGLTDAAVVAKPELPLFGA